MLQPFGKHSSFVIAPYNVRTYASYLDNSATIYDNYIHFSSGTTNEKLLEVPLTGPGETDCNMNTVIKITFAFDPDLATAGTDHDIRIGITDGSYYNQFGLYDRYTIPCVPISATQTNNGVAETNAPGQVTLMFQPFHKYGACYTAQDGGYVNIGTFTSQLDTSKGISLLVNRKSSGETYYYYYFLIEIMG